MSGMLRMMAPLLAGAFYGLGCGSSGQSASDGGRSDSTARDSASSDGGGHADVRGDGGAGEDVAAHYPASHAPAPQAVNSGGPVLAAPNIVPIFFGGDPLQPEIEAFLAALATSSYWPAVTSEYSVGPLTIAPSIVVSDPSPTTISNPEISVWLAAYLDGTHAAWPPITLDNIYMVFYPESTVITDPSVGTSCTDFGGYHYAGAEPRSSGPPDGGVTHVEGGSMDASADTGPPADAGTTPFVYAVIPRCATFAGHKGIDAVTATVSHESVEASSDPLGSSVPAYAGVDSAHIVWDLSPGGEIADLCAYEAQSFQRLVGTYLVQRIWSNAAAKASQDPCVPALTGTTYYNATPDLTENVIITYEGGHFPTVGVLVPIGQTKTIDIQLFSTAPTAEWSVSIEDVSFAYGGPKLVDFDPSFFSGRNGDVVPVKVTPVALGPEGGTEFIMYSYVDAATYTNYWFGFVEN
jgi:hypothetical protein